MPLQLPRPRQSYCDFAFPNVVFHMLSRQDPSTRTKDGLIEVDTSTSATLRTATPSQRTWFSLRKILSISSNTHKRSNGSLMKERAGSTSLPFFLCAPGGDHCFRRGPSNSRGLILETFNCHRPSEESFIKNTTDFQLTFFHTKLILFAVFTISITLGSRLLSQSIDAYSI